MTDAAVAERRHDLDWVRILAVLLLAPYHAAMVFWGQGYHVVSPSISPLLALLARMIQVWQMPVLFLVSGAATYFGLRRRTPGRYVAERFQRLLVPLTFGVLVIIPPEVYIERLQRGQFAGGFLAFYPRFFKGVYPAGNLSWHHLWFLAYLFAFSLAALPLFLWLGREPGRKALATAAAWLCHGSRILWLAAPIALVEFALRIRWPHFHMNLVDDWANIFYFGAFFVYGYLFCADGRFWESIERNRMRCLVVALVALFILFGMARPERGYNLPYMTRMGFRGFTSVCWVLAILGYAKRYLTRSSGPLGYASEACLPFYIIHQTPLLIAAYFVVKMQVGVMVQFALINLATLAATLAIYEVLVHRIAPVRWLFGMRARASRQGGRKRSTVNPAEVRRGGADC